MSTPDALRLADRLDANLGDTRKPAAAELRRQHAEIERLRDELNLCCALKLEYQQQAAGGIERQHAEIERLEQYSAHCEEVIAAHNAVGARQEAEIERLRADAARYRWLRDNTEGAWAICEWADDSDGIGFYRDSRKPGTVVDSAIDAAMRDAL